MNLIGYTDKPGRRRGDPMCYPQLIIGDIRSNADGNGAVSFSPDTIPDMSWWIDPNDDSTITRVGLTDEIDFLDDKSPSGSSTSRLQRYVAPFSHSGLFATTSAGVQWMDGRTAEERLLHVAFEAEPNINFGSAEFTAFYVIQREYTDTSTRYAAGVKGDLARYATIARENVDGEGALFSQINDGGTGATVIASTGTIPLSSPVIVRLVRNNSVDTYSMYVDGTFIGSQTTVGVGSLDDYTQHLFIGAAPAAAGMTQFWWEGLIGEILFYKRVLSSSEITQIEDYLSAKWGT